MRSSWRIWIWVNNRVTGDTLFKGLITMRCLKGCFHAHACFSYSETRTWVQGSQLHLYHATDAVKEKKGMLNPPMCDIKVGFSHEASGTLTIGRRCRRNDRNWFKQSNFAIKSCSRRLAVVGCTIAKVLGQVSLDPSQYPRAPGLPEMH